MPYNPGISYHGDQYLFQGLSGLGSGIAEAIQKLHDQQKQTSYNDMVVQHAVDRGDIGPEEMAKYNDMSATQKTGFAGGLAANIVNDWKREEMKSQSEARLASAQARQFQPSDQAQQLARATGNELLPTGAGHFQVVPYGGTGNDAVVTDPLIIGGQTVPGIGVNRKTGQYVYFGGMQGGIQIQTDPTTGIPFYRDAKGNPKPLTGQQIMAGQMNQPPKTPTGGAGGDMNFIQKFLTDWGLAKPNAAPSPTPPAAPSAPALQTAAPPATGASAARQQAITILQQNNKPVTEPNIQYLIKQLGGQ